MISSRDSKTSHSLKLLIALADIHSDVPKMCRLCAHLLFSSWQMNIE
ncbi:hypothetical protein [Niallia circulans]|nr:hypothetical protein [Niallia circulans]